MYVRFPDLATGLTLDQVHAVLFQYMEFLAASLEPDELASTVPAVHELMGTYGLEPAVAFDIARPKLRRALRVRFPRWRPR